MAEPTAKTIKRLFAVSGNICAFPGCALPIVDKAGTVTGEICHITARRPGGPRYDHSLSNRDRNGFGNLILLCGHHHTVIDSEYQVYTADVLQDMKSIHEKIAGRPEQASDIVFAKMLLNDMNRITVSQNTGNVVINSPGAIQAREVHIRTSRRSVSINALPGTIGFDQGASRYVQYLIERYNKFASADRTRASRFNYGAISKNVESNFGAQWRLLSMETFDAVCEYLQKRIERTIIAKTNAAKGMRAYSSYSEFSTR
ncbi:HNH endonuclease signature motif containing protein [Paracoccus sp. (in: a-proteobacteria)]|uniref:HNH endonuclease signature motif containing protein n=1 Tax=Paracoccus sp. TaxID=267 RepID=UPI002AFE8320|nr:HNH endonuclease signature motif containing protein [Paracoccus sp. (in: a-proteobacteria)]